MVAYSPSAGIDPLREQIQQYYGRLGHELNQDNVLVTTGASEALSFIFAALMDPSDEVIVPEPFLSLIHI